MPGLFEQFPHTNLHELNLDWLINMINQFKEELENSAVLSVNGETGHVTLYESENVILPALPSGVDQWRLVRLMGGQYVGILFYNGHAYIQRGNENMRLLTLEDIPTSSGVVSWNGLTGVVNVTGANIPVDDSADADSIDQAITTEHTERVNADNALSNSINATNQALSNVNNELDTFLHIPTETYSGDLNTLLTPGMYKLGSGATNTPPTLSAGRLEVSVGDNKDYVRQTYYGGYNVNIFTRTRFFYNGAFTWNNWQELALNSNVVKGSRNDSNRHIGYMVASTVDSGNKRIFFYDENNTYIGFTTYE